MFALRRSLPTQVGTQGPSAAARGGNSHQTLESALKRYLSILLSLVTFGIVPAAAQTQPPRGTVRYYHGDAVGTTRLVTDAQGAEVERHDYMPFGVELTAPTATTPRLFGGKQHDAETGLDYF